MDSTLILWPVIIQIILTISLFLVLGARKAKAIKSGGVDREMTALNNDAWPDDVRKVSNNIQNQFQTPILFYVLSIAFVVTNTVSVTVLALAWGYAVSRIIHAYVHTSSNYVPVRFKVFIAGFLCLIGLTGILATHLLSIS